MKKILFLFLILWIGLIFTACLQDANPKSYKTTSDRELSFVWEPEKNEYNISNVANRFNYGIIDGDEETLYYQSKSKSSEIVYALYSYDLTNHSVEELSSDCYGMINVTDNYVYYIGYETKGIFRYDKEKKRSNLIYSDDVKNLLVTQTYIYVINSKNQLLIMDLNGNNVKEIMKEVSPHYLDCIDGYVYFSQVVDISNTYNLYGSEIGDPIQITQICNNIGYPIKYWNNKILFKDLTGVYLLNLEINKKMTINIDNESLLSVNGNGIFYTKTDRDGYTELMVYDLNSSKTYNLAPTHYNIVYFINQKIYIVDVANFNVEAVDLSNPDYIHTVKLEL